VPGELQSEASICVEQLQPYDTLFPQFTDECYQAGKKKDLLNKQVWLILNNQPRFRLKFSSSLNVYFL